MKGKKRKTAVDHITDALGELCDNYCKYAEQMQGMTETEAEKMIDKVCAGCPINKII